MQDHGKLGFCTRVRSYSAALTLEWERDLDAHCNVVVRGITVTPQGTVILTGGLRGEADFGGGQVIVPTDLNAGFVVALSK